MLAVFVVIIVIMAIILVVSLFGESAVFYGLGLITALLLFNIRVYILLLAYLLFSRRNLPRFLQDKQTVVSIPAVVEVREEKIDTPQ